MSNFYTPGSGNGSSSNGSSFVSRRDIRANNATGALPAISTSTGGRGYTGQFDFEAMLVSLHDLFEHDRQVASQTDSSRCGICYLYYSLSELRYREEGYYVCSDCERTLGRHTMPMLRRQQK
ncbi:MAG: hypothetical protein ACJ8BW_23370 [Ktedonobacteraceae bacterium]